MTAKPELPDVPKTGEELRDAIEALVAAVTDPVASINGANDSYSKCAEAMWQAGYLAHEYLAAKLGVTGFQHGYSRLKLLGMLAGYKGPYMVLDGSDVLYPQYDLLRKVEGWIKSDEFRGWAAEQARALLEERGSASPTVTAHWERLASTPATSATSTGGTL